MDEINSPPPCLNSVTVRRNPHRRARPQPTPATAALGIPIPSSSSSAVPELRSFPTDEILSMDIAKPKSDPLSENIRVFLRIRPLLHGGVGGDRNTKPRFKNAWPQNPAKKNSAIERSLQNKKKKNAAEACIRVNSPQSVTLSPPSALQENNRIKTEVYDGFSHVFSPDSSQEELYEKMVRPLVDDFLMGKSGMLAALGPSGSGKTHTVFGCPRQPGMVPLALQQIFKQTSGSSSESTRSFFISIFEISSERGKGERLFDLSPNGGDLSMQQSTLKGLKEVAISEARQVESLIAQAMLKRATGTTNANSQSSRSQCIINIRGVADKSYGEGNDHATDGILSIVDLAGAEREKRTGNQGARLLESSFINNTSMVFGLCLRSLLEHQKNPKKPLQKHFQNSLLTKYLRDYLEGKKRMALILTVKSGEEDYRDTSYVLRQASPYMEIKYNIVEEPSNISLNKRHVQASSRSERHKRMKVTGSDACVIDEGKGIEAANGLSEEVSTKGNEDPGIYKVDTSGCAPSKPGSVDSGQGERNHQIMQNFAKALWNVLKQYNEKLKVTDNEIQHLRESLMTEHTKRLELEKELKDIKSGCSCSHRKSVEGSLVELDVNFQERVQLDSHESGNVDETSYLRECDSNSTFKEDKNNFSQVQVKNGAFPVNWRGFGCIANGDDVDTTPLQSQNNEQKVDATVRSLGVGEVSASCLEPENPNVLDHQTCQSLSGSGCSAEDLCEFERVKTEDSRADVAGSAVNSFQSLLKHRKDSCSSVELDHVLSEEDSCPALCPSPRDFSGLDVGDVIEKPRELLVFPPSPKEDLVSTEGCDVIDIPDNEPRGKTATKAEKPKRRLLPASSLLLRDFSSLDVEDDDEKPKGGKKKSAVEETKRTQGSLSLMRLLQRNLRV